MELKRLKNTVSLFVLILFASFLLIGGCDVDFGTSENNGGGGDGNTGESVKGTIIDVIPSRENDVENITAQLMDDGDLSTFSSTTGGTGFFDINGNFVGTPTLEFLDEEDNASSLGQIIINVFPDSRLQLGDIRLENGTVVLEDDLMVTFEGDITQNDCQNNSGSLEVEINNDNGDDVDVLVQINNSTDIEDNDNNDIDCEDLLIGQEVEINGELFGIGNNVEADRIEQQ